jgi:hypothetical protein
MKKRTEKYCPDSGISHSELESYTVDDIETMIVSYLGVKTAPEPMQDMQRDMARPAPAAYSHILVHTGRQIHRYKPHGRRYVGV